MQKKTALFAYQCDPESRRGLEETLSGRYNLAFYDDPEALRRAAKERHYSLLLIRIAREADVPSSLIRSLAEQDPAAPILILCGPDDIRRVDGVLKPGSYDILSTPLVPSTLYQAVHQALHRKRQDFELAYLRGTQDIVYSFDRIVAESENFKAVLNSMRKYAATDATILITGETGTGKSFLSGAIHYNSPRRAAPFIKINCANISESLLESELFGHERGAFTGADKQRIGRFEQADGGTIFLDEIGEISPEIQSKLLRVLEEKAFERVGGNKTIHVDVRLIAATNKDLAQQIGKGKFREDLYYRINVLPVHLPPLRERQACIGPLSMRLLQKIATSMKKDIQGFAPGVLELMRRYNWPGSIRQLANTIERAVILEDGRFITTASLQIADLFFPQPAQTLAAPKPETAYPPPAEPVYPVLKNHEKELIIQALERHLWVQKNAAAALGISPRALNYKVRKFGITHPNWRKNKEE